MEEKYIVALKEIKTPDITDNYSLQSWKSKAINIVTRIYGKDSKQEEQINLIRFKTYPTFGSYSPRGGSKTFGGGNNAAHCQKQATEVIDGLITDIKNFGIPEKDVAVNSDKINITVNQNQSQTINIKILVDALQNELTGRQLNEVQEIIEEDMDKQEKRKKIIDKIKSFGGDIASNVIANILTNPAIYGGM
ncbi:hypothetical protein GCM10009122_26720 [Fulvivirga kasyanovii]|uniref:Peptide chain release factor 1 n=1 Tax=Fulvivirga kasyanovii TaxID=396812 RepID=A0ABW9RPP7_9BACT|nr:hypothetical protein [Fulvivirga kasyanovii]MTI26123.1 hypothetical protein [Fulvivirga kasyanovii]